MAETEIPGQPDITPDSVGKGRGRRRILIVFGIVIGALVLGVVFLPKPVARYVIADQLDKLGIVHKGVDTLEIDLWRQEVKVGPLAFQGSNAVLPGRIGQFSLKLRLVNLLRHRAIVDHVIIDGVDLKLQRTSEGAISINGIALQDFIAKQDGGAPPAPDEDPWQAALEKLQLRNSRVVLDQQGAGELTVNIARLDLEGFRTWEPDKPGKFDLDATVNGVSFKWRGEARPFADKITLTTDATVNDVEIAKIEKYFGSLGLERRGGTLSSRFNHDVSLHADGRIDWATKGIMEISKADIAVAGRGGVGFDAAKAEITAKFSVQAGDEVDATSGVNFVMRKSRAVTPDGQSVAVEELALDMPRVDLKMAAKALSLSAAGTASLKGAVVAVPSIGGRPAAGIEIGSLQAPVGGFSLSLMDGAPRWQAAFSLAAKDLAARVARGDAADVRLASLSADDVRVDQTLAVTMKTLLLGGLKAKLSEKILPPAETKQARTVVKETDSAAPATRRVGITIGRLALVDRGDIQFRDASVTPAVDFKLAVERLELANLAIGSAQQKSDLKFKAKINEFTDLDLSGWAAPFGLKPDFDLKLTLKGLELPRFSPYVAKAVGMHMESGQLNLDAAVTGKQAGLDGRLVVNLRNLELGDLSPEDAKKISDAVGMPVQTAVGLLQDSDKAINLEIPVSGTVTDPDLDLSEAVQKAVAGALASIFPPTAIASMLLSASKGGATFAPIPFRVGTATLDTAGKSIAAKLARLLASRPKLTLRVCGRTTLGDVEQYKALILDQQRALRLEKSAKPGSAALTVAEILQSAKNPMGKLALDRTRAVRRFLLAQDKALTGRISECRSVYNPKDKNPPRADVTL